MAQHVSKGFHNSTVMKNKLVNNGSKMNTSQEKEKLPWAFFTGHFFIVGFFWMRHS